VRAGREEMAVRGEANLPKGDHEALESIMDVILVGATARGPMSQAAATELRMCHIERRRHSPRKLERQSLMSRTRTSPLRVGKKGAETSAGHQAPKPSAA
jgi:hypothetical protein